MPATPADDPAPDAIAWTSWPLRDDLPRSVYLVLVVLAFPVGAAWAFESVAAGLLSLAVLLGATRRYFVPTGYRVDEDGASVDGVRRRWSEVRGCYPHRDGVFLSPFSAPSRLDPFRGLWLRYAGNRREVEAFVLARVRGAAPPAPPPGPAS